MLLKVHEKNPNIRKIQIAVELLKKGGVIIYPTDTIYALGCDIKNLSAIKAMAKIKGIKAGKAYFSIICENISQVSEYANVSNEVFKLLKKNLPGAFTFILPANNHLKKVFGRKTIGVRMPENLIVQALVKHLNNPIVTTSIKDDDKILEYTTDPDLLFEKYKKNVDALIDGGYGKNIASTVVDYTSDEIMIIRQGIGELIF